MALALGAYALRLREDGLHFHLADVLMHASLFGMKVEGTSNTPPSVENPSMTSEEVDSFLYRSFNIDFRKLNLQAKHTLYLCATAADYKMTVAPDELSHWCPLVIAAQLGEETFANARAHMQETIDKQIRDVQQQVAGTSSRVLLRSLKDQSRTVQNWKLLRMKLAADPLALMPEAAADGNCGPYALEALVSDNPLLPK